MRSWRHIPPVVTTGSWSSLARATVSIAHPSARAAHELESALSSYYGRPVLALTDSGTSALRWCLERTVQAGAIVGIPGFGCIDVAAAVQGAGCRAIAFDVEPSTLAPVTQSVREVLARGATAIVASHLFGLPADLTDALTLCREHGALLIEDCAQAFGARLDDKPVGTLGDFTILSFGRGKGVGGGGGGACLATAALATSHKWQPWADDTSWTWADDVRTVVTCAIVQVLNRPALYALPRAVPSLRLGEMVYHPSRTPARIGRAASFLAAEGMRQLGHDRPERLKRVSRLHAAAAVGNTCSPVHPLPRGMATWLRAPMLLHSGVSTSSVRLGAYRPYPNAAPAQREVADIFLLPFPGLAGAEVLAQRLITLPTHERVSEHDLEALEQWLHGGDHAR